jgi:starch phosphorylase
VVSTLVGGTALAPQPRTPAHATPDTPSITKSIVNHVQTSLARQAYNIDAFGAYQATALAARDDLIVNWNATQLHYNRKEPKRAYYLSLEFLMGRSLDNALLNLDLKKPFAEGVEQLGFNLEDLIKQERDAGLGNGGLGRLAACYLDSSASQDLPLWGYGLRYQYGIFQQLIGPDGTQLEAPDPWLVKTNPWEIPRPDVAYDIRFYGHAEREADGKAIWYGGQEVVAVAYDMPVRHIGLTVCPPLRLSSALGPGLCHEKHQQPAPLGK